MFFASLTPGVCTVSSTQATLINIGQCSIQATQPGNPNYQAATPVTQTFSVIASDLTIAKSHVGHFSQGQNGAIYTIQVTNSGNGPTNGSLVTVTDTLPAGLTATSLAGTGWTCAALSCSRSDVLTNGFSYPPITLTVNVDPSAPANVTNQVSVSGGGEVNLSNDTANDPTVINPVVDVSSQVIVAQSGFARNRATGLLVATLTLTSKGGPISGPVQVVLTNLTPGVTMTNNSGTRNGSPYITLSAGVPSSVQIQFSNPSGGFISFTPVIDSGIF